MLATNNAMRVASQYTEKLARFGVEVAPERILTSSEATAGYLAHAHPEVADYPFTTREPAPAMRAHMKAVQRRRDSIRHLLWKTGPSRPGQGSASPGDGGAKRAPQCDSSIPKTRDDKKGPALTPGAPSQADKSDLIPTFPIRERDLSGADAK